MGFFQKIINGLKKTKQAIGFKLNELFQRGIFDDKSVTIVSRNHKQEEIWP